MSPLDRQAGALAALLTALVRGGEAVLVPSTLAVAGAVGLTVYGLIALGPLVLRRLLTPAAAPPSPPPDAASP